MKDYHEMKDDNTKQFEQILEKVSPDFFYIYKTMRESEIHPSQMMEIVHKVGLIKRLDDGFGKIIVDCQNHGITRIRMIQDKIVKPIREEVEL